MKRRGFLAALLSLPALSLFKKAAPPAEIVGPPKPVAFGTIDGVAPVVGETWHFYSNGTWDRPNGVYMVTVGEWGGGGGGGGQCRLPGEGIC